MKKSTTLSVQEGSNGYATKDDLRKLKLSIDNSFDRFEHRFEWFKDSWEWWKKDTFRLFEHRWQQLIDPVLKEITDMRDAYEIEMGRSAENRERIDSIEQTIVKMDGRVGKIERGMENVQGVIGRIAKKVGA